MEEIYQEKQEQLNLIAIQIAMMSSRVVQSVVLSTHLVSVLLMVRLATSVVRKTTFLGMCGKLARKVIPGLQRG